MIALVIVGSVLTYVAIGMVPARYCFLANDRVPKKMQLSHGQIAAIWLLWPVAVTLLFGGFVFRHVIIRPRNEDSQDSSDKA